MDFRNFRKIKSNNKWLNYALGSAGALIVIYAVLPAFVIVLSTTCTTQTGTVNSCYQYNHYLGGGQTAQCWTNACKPDSTNSNSYTVLNFGGAVICPRPNQPSC